MEYIYKKFFNIKYNSKNNLIDIGQAGKWITIKQNRFIVIIVGVTVGMITVNGLLIAKFIQLLQIV